uniref:Uncharacterized protein n=1 Tax=Candidatus Kentrum sp. MB TaxID=2138164 RepID=A0A451BH34_9GAMM|nr:MAG: hypothetical protein BECKMB1821I_GA0114274_11803 [Candidatus Kentron sp. MB]VFK77600.1 MAG: hypothetical protein BECKMB1821H_GA0114242_11783 [Candidatus Kentron sp. MB]
MNTILHPFRPPFRSFLTALTILLTLGMTTPIRAVEHIVNFESNLGSWTAIKGASHFNWTRHAGKHPLRAHRPQ